MKAMIATQYGGPDVVEAADLPVPAPGPGEVLVKVHAAGVTTADWRMRAAAFPGGFAVLGRAMFGLTGPRQKVLGGDFAGVVAAVGSGVSEYKAGARVYGFSGTGAHAEYLTIRADGAIAPIPAGLGFAEAAALPFGMLAAWQFLTRFGSVSKGDRVLVVGGSGGVGVYAVQIAAMLGAEVNAVASEANAGLMRDLGAHETVDYRKADPLETGPYDLIFDTVGATRWRQARRALKPGGLYLPLNFAVWDIVPSLLSRLGGKRFVIGVNDDRGEDLRALAEPLAEGILRPVIDRRFDFDDIRAAYRLVETRHRKGAVVLEIGGETQEAAA